MNKYKKLLITIFVSSLATGMNYIISLFLTPYITNEIGAEAYGFVTLAKTFISYAGIITLALNSYATRYIAIAYHEGDRERCNKYFSSVLYADVILGLAIFAVFSIVIWRLESLLSISSELVSQVRFLFMLTAVGFTITTIGTVFQSSAYIKNQLDKTNIFKGISYVLEAIILILLFSVFKAQLWYVGIGTLVSTIFIVLTNILLYKSYTPDIKVSCAKVSIDAIKELVLAGIWNALNSLGNMLNTGLDLIVSNLMLTALAMGQLAIAKTVSSMFYALFQLIAQPFQPMLLKSYSENNKGKLLDDLITSIKIAGLVSNIAFAGFATLGLMYYELWIPTQDIELIWKLTVLSLLGSVIEGAIYPLYYIYTLTVKNKIPSIVTIIGGLLNVGGMFFLIRYTNLGVYAIVLTTTVIMTFISLIFNPLYMTKCLDIKWTTFYPSILKHIVSCIIMVGTFYVVSLIPSPTSWMWLLIKAAICVVMGSIEHLLIVGIKPSVFIRIIKHR